MAGEHPVAGVDYPRNWHELLAWFPDDGRLSRSPWKFVGGDRV
jgi:hypothetical protein